MTEEVTDIWFRSRLPLDEIANRLGLQDLTLDAENYWAWVIGTRSDVKLDITRTHTKPAGQVDTRIFVLNEDESSTKPFSEALLVEVVSQLQAFVTGSIYCGQWKYRSGNDFDFVVIREFSEDANTKASSSSNPTSN